MGKQIGQAAVGYNLVIKFMMMLTCPLFCGLLGGAYLDKTLSTTPWLMFILTLTGLVFSVYAVYRVSMRMIDASTGSNTDGSATTAPKTAQSQDKEID